MSIFIVVSCSNRDNKNYYKSKLLNNFKLIEIDSLIYYNNDTLFISQTGDIKVWKNYILITDFNFMKLWVFDKKLKLVKTIGKKGNGPGEFMYPPTILADNDSLWLINTRYKKANLYNDNFDFIKEIKMAKEKIFPPYNPISIDGKFIFPYLEPAPISTVEYYKKYNSLAVLNKYFQYVESFLPWDNYYLNASAYAFNNAITLLAKSKDSFIALQRATYILHKFDKDLINIKSFGIKPKYYKQPPSDISFEQTQKSVEALTDFSSKITDFLKIDFDSTNNYYYANYVNLDKDFFYQRTLLLGKHFLQVYNAEYDCIYDGPIPGKLAFVTEEKIYVLTEEKPEYIKFKVFSLTKN